MIYWSHDTMLSPCPLDCGGLTDVEGACPCCRGSLDSGADPLDEWDSALLAAMYSERKAVNEWP